jgi:hypothetical protein
VTWRTSSPDLSSLDFFIWGFVIRKYVQTTDASPWQSYGDKLHMQLLKLMLQCNIKSGLDVCGIIKDTHFEHMETKLNEFLYKYFHCCNALLIKYC